MAQTVAPERVDEVEQAGRKAPDLPWVTVVWDDPINLMSYVVYVLEDLFGYDRVRATALMLDVHHKGRATVSAGTRERMELDVTRLHNAGLWATLQRA
ncbi:MAG: ATP-dependent Clp protease adapter ClpS [Actinobacteria bacterium]|nr:ATP-dependent Clp protease adapter ClpS [Actinomycetota bacterium]